MSEQPPASAQGGAGIWSRFLSIPASLRIAAAYVLVSVIWIVSSDRAVEVLFSMTKLPVTEEQLQTIKGTFFVLFTGVLLWMMIERHSQRLHRLNDEIRQSEGRWRNLMAEMPVPVCVLQHGVIQYMNHAAEELLGAGAKLVGTRLIDRSPAESRGELEQVIRQLEMFAESPKAPAQEFEDLTLIAADGRLIHVDLMARESLSGPQAVGLVIMDVTERQRIAQLSAQATRMEAAATVAAGVAHDFNNVFMAIMGQVALARNITGVARELDRPLGLIENLSKQAAGMTRSLLSFAQTPVSDRRARPVMPVLRQLADLARGVLPRAIDFEFRAEGLDQAHAMLDPGQFQHAMLNIVLNARDSMLTTLPPGQHKLTMTCRRLGVATEPGRLEIRMQDTGSGIAPELIEKVFAPFFTTKPPGKGSGLGLALARSTMKDHNGTVTVESDPGCGATFVIHMPLIPAPVEHERTLPKGSIEAKRPTVLIGEDNPAVRPALAEWLRSHGFAVIEAADGDGVMQALEADRSISAALLDVNLPAISGPECLRRIRAGEQAHGLSVRESLPVILTSGGPFPEIEEPLMRNTAVLPKPFSTQDLMQTLRQSIETGTN